MLHEKKPCIVCARDTTADLRTCTGCRESLCRHCIKEHVCGEDGRPELVQLLSEHVAEHKDTALTMVKIYGVLIAYLPRHKVISEHGLQALVSREMQRAGRIEALPKNISESLCRAPLNARGALCFAASNGFDSFFAAKEADTPEVLAQVRAMMEVRRLISF